MIKLRTLEYKDIPHMIEWMRYEENKNIFQNNFLTFTEEDARKFIEDSITEQNINFAIVNDTNDEYLGTISLKNINKKNRNAEYAISTRKKIRGTGVSFEATKLILDFGFHQLNLIKIYLNVLTTNKRAIRFYKKVGFKYEGTFFKHLMINNQLIDLEWYAYYNEEIKNYD